MAGIITITTDFGDVYPGIMKGVIAGISTALQTVDITNTLPSGAVQRGAFVLRYASGHFPEGSVHLGVVDPGVGSDRRALIIKGERYWFVGPDNGILMPAARAQGNFRTYEITDLAFYARQVSPVFHGRDVFAPAAALIAAGKEVPGLREIFDPVDLDFGEPRIEGNAITGRVIYIDSFGNAVTNIGGDALNGLCYLGERLTINGWHARFVRAFYESSGDELIILAGSHGMAEIASKGGSAAAIANLKDGSEVRIVPKGHGFEK